MKKKIFLASDHHFRHRKIVEEFGRTHFTTIDQHDQHILERHNSTVGENDICIFLGDVFLKTGNVEDYKFLENFNGKKYLVLGNHDSPARVKEFQKYFSKIMAYHTLGKMDNRKADIILSHLPVHPCNFDDRFKANIHGHLHDEVVCDKNGNEDERYVSVCMEHIDYTPVEFEEIYQNLKDKGII